MEPQGGFCGYEIRRIIYHTISVEHVKEYFKDLPSIRPASRKATYRWLTIFGVIFLASIDFWDWGSARLAVLGFPRWVWYFIAFVHSARRGYGRVLQEILEIGRYAS